MAQGKQKMYPSRADNFLHFAHSKEKELLAVRLTSVRVVHGMPYEKYPCEERKASRKCTQAVPITSYTLQTARGKRTPCRAVNVRPRGTRQRDSPNAVRMVMRFSQGKQKIQISGGDNETTIAKAV